MIHLQCPKCGKAIDVPDDSAGQTSTCPHCGNVNAVPPAAPGEPAGALAPPVVPAQLAEKDARMWAMLCHLGGLTGYVVPFGQIIAPLVIWLIQKDKSSFVDAHGKQALNFQISWTIYALASGILVFVCVGFALLMALAVAELVLVILAALAANDGKPYKYPLTIQFLK